MISIGNKLDCLLELINSTHTVPGINVRSGMYAAARLICQDVETHIDACCERDGGARRLNASILDGLDEFFLGATMSTQHQALVEWLTGDIGALSRRLVEQTRPHLRVSEGGKGISL